MSCCSRSGSDDARAGDAAPPTVAGRDPDGRRARLAAAMSGGPGGFVASLTLGPPPLPSLRQPQEASCFSARGKACVFASHLPRTTPHPLSRTNSFRARDSVSAIADKAHSCSGRQTLTFTCGPLGQIKPITGVRRDPGGLPSDAVPVPAFVDLARWSGVVSGSTGRGPCTFRPGWPSRL